MEIFVSWSGDRSRAVAEAFRKWLPKVIQAIDPWISVEIAKGKRWSLEIADKLSKTRFGILCLTSDNLESPWLLFEAGAISKMGNSRAFTFLLDLRNTDVKPPLGDFQHTQFSKDEVRRLVGSINDALPEAGDKALPADVLNDAFDRTWPEFEKVLKAISVARPAERKDDRADSDKLDEILEVVRGMSIPRPSAWSEGDGTKLELAKAYSEIGDHMGGREILIEILKGAGPPTIREEARALLRQLDEPSTQQILAAKKARSAGKKRRG
jgi:FimV-like protein